MIFCRKSRQNRRFIDSKAPSGAGYSFVSILGATVDLGLLWSIADTFNGLMSIPNLLALLLLSGTVVRLTKEFFASEG